ncbi:MAG: hypothetical protein R3345_11490 [Fulvivirga sp.]|nr:hypothetical protein [Fulvivirga sp.]
MDLDIKSELDRWQDYLIKNGFLKSKKSEAFIDYIQTGVENQMFALYEDNIERYTYRPISLKIENYYPKGQPVTCIWKEIKTLEPKLYERIEADYKSRTADKEYGAQILLTTITNLDKDLIGEEGIKYPLLELTYRLSFDKTYLIRQREMQLGLDPSKIHGSPASVMETIFEAANSGDVSKLKFLCNPYSDTEADVKLICNVPSWPPWEKEHFIEYFKGAEITGNVRIFENEAQVPFKFKSGHESMKMIRIGEMWFLQSF